MKNLSKIYSWLHLHSKLFVTVANSPPTCRRPVANQLPTNPNPFPISWQSIADLSPTGRRFLGIVVADQSRIALQPKNADFLQSKTNAQDTVANQFLIAQWLHWLQLFFSRKAVADRLQYMCDRGFIGDIQRRCPRASIILSKIPPRKKNKDVLNNISRENSFLQHRATESDGVWVIDVCPQDPALYRKYLVHFNVKGCRVYAKQMHSKLSNFLRFSHQMSR